MNARTVRIISRAIALCTILAITGCGPSQSVNPFALRKENTQLKAALRQYQDQLAQAKVRADGLDADNEQLHNELAMAQEASRHHEDHSKLAARAPVPPTPRDDYSDEEKDFGPATGRQSRSGGSYDRTASSGRGGGGGKGGDWAQMGNISGAQVLQDGDALRIRVTNTSLFDPGKATLKPGATKVLDQVAASIRRSYPGQLVGIEGHTDGDPIRKSNWKDNHELSYQRARAVMEYLSAKGGIAKDQLYVAAYGPNAPIASNKSSNGKAQNRRVEFVLQPGNGGRAAVDGPAAR